MTPPASSRRVLPALALAALGLLASSCRRGPVCYPVRGQVLVDNRPAEGALVVLVPADNKDPLAPRPSGIVGADGSFMLRTYDTATQSTHDGAPPGPYVATVLWPPGGAGQPLTDKQKEELQDRLQGRYADPASSPLRGVQVKEGPNELGPFRLSAAGRKGDKR
jgi:hypothetical protein